MLAQLEVADQRYAAEMRARKLAEEKEQESSRIKEDLKKSEQMYRTLFESANDAIMLMEDDCLMDCNAKTIEMFGCTRKDRFSSSKSINPASN